MMNYSVKWTYPCNGRTLEVTGNATQEDIDAILKITSRAAKNTGRPIRVIINGKVVA